MSSFPVEIYYHILAQLPPLRDSNSSVYTLVNCSETNSLLRYVSTIATLWKPHYQIRYRHSNEREEEERKSRTGSDWRALYVERRRLEYRALSTMKNVILGNIESFRPAGEESEEGHDGHPAPWLQVVGRSIVQLGMDIFDMLDILQRTAPRRLRGAPEETELAYEHPTSPWKSWAMYLKGLVLRHDAISRWIRMKDNPKTITFERALAGLSAFYGVSYVEISDALDSLASECRDVFVSFGVPIPENLTELRPDDVAGICEKICGFMRNKGFSPCHSFVPPEDLFPHRFISVQAARTNIPMVLVHVFVAICRRFNIAASATNFPSRVLAHVAPGGGLPDFWVDVFNSETRPILQRDDVLQVWNRILAFPSSFARSTEPCTPQDSLIRQANNIMASIRNVPMGSSEPRSSTMYPVASILCFLDTMQWPAGFGVVPDIDLEAVLGDLVAPHIPPDNRFHTILKTWTRLEGLSHLVCKRGESSPTTVSPKYFVGMVVCSSSDEFAAACIIDWIVSELTTPDAFLG
ncbi:hypothetical protein BDM02DRAFT_3182033 [Thelephora ganbajun]|uniref:Uncharacterized protein n=1 Tax=Thelephora ganbajun TaxID=370292 RepID=A0ACB6ZWK8_THEGA|nr:hypothetical protein BDM02DRAFT_3182033 [Thelephora ganbajun]